MPSGPHGATIQRARHGEPQPVAIPAPAAESEANQREPTKKDLTSWWRNFKRGNQRRDDDGEAPSPLEEAGSPGKTGRPLADDGTEARMRWPTRLRHPKRRSCYG